MPFIFKLLFGYFCLFYFLFSISIAPSAAVGTLTCAQKEEIEKQRDTCEEASLEAEAATKGIDVSSYALVGQAAQTAISAGGEKSAKLAHQGNMGLQGTLAAVALKRWHKCSTAISDCRTECEEVEKIEITSTATPNNCALIKQKAVKRANRFKNACEALSSPCKQAGLQAGIAGINAASSLLAMKKLGDGNEKPTGDEKTQSGDDDKLKIPDFSSQDPSTWSENSDGNEGLSDSDTDTNTNTQLLPPEIEREREEEEGGSDNPNQKHNKNPNSNKNRLGQKGPDFSDDFPEDDFPHSMSAGEHSGSSHSSGAISGGGIDSLGNGNGNGNGDGDLAESGENSEGTGEDFSEDPYPDVPSSFAEGMDQFSGGGFQRSGSRRNLRKKQASLGKKFRKGKSRKAGLGKKSSTLDTSDSIFNKMSKFIKSYCRRGAQKCN